MHTDPSFSTLGRIHVWTGSSLEGASRLSCRYITEARGSGSKRAQPLIIDVRCSVDVLASDSVRRVPHKAILMADPFCAIQSQCMQAPEISLSLRILERTPKALRPLRATYQVRNASAAFLVRSKGVSPFNIAFLPV
jgi:hypothetical protein